MDIDREVSEQIMAVESLLAEICATASTACGGLR
jgi:hypothetical protein